MKFILPPKWGLEYADCILSREVRSQKKKKKGVGGGNVLCMTLNCIW